MDFPPNFNTVNIYMYLCLVLYIHADKNIFMYFYLSIILLQCCK